MSLKDYEDVIVKAHNMGALWPERRVSRKAIESVEAKLAANSIFGCSKNRQKKRLRQI